MRSERRRTLMVAVAVVALGIVAVLFLGRFGADETGSEEAHFTVVRGPLVISVTEAGSIKNREQVEIKCEVEGRTAILSLASEGTQVQPGDLLVELDSSGLVEQQDTQQIKVINAEAAHIRARENLAVAESQAESDVAKAELDLRFANLDLEKYEEGEYPQMLQQADAAITIARENVQRATDKLDWSTKLHAKRYLSRVELQADELALKTADLDLMLAEGSKALLEKYTYQRDLKRLQSDIEQAKRALERTKRKASADIVQAKADLRAKEQERSRQEAQLAKLRDQITKCRIVAPVAGMVVYATTGRGGWRGRQEPLEEGQEVRERQELIHLPTATSMMAEVNVHESSLEKVRVGLPVFLTVDAAQGKVFRGKVARIAVLPDAQSVWLNPDLKLYATDVYIDGEANGLRPGMSCKAEIFVERYDDAIQIPVQAVVRVDGDATVYLRTENGPVARTIRIGLDNNRMVHVLEGLAAGEEVLLEPPLGNNTGAAPKPEDLPTIEIPDPPVEPNGPPKGADGRRGPPEGRRRERGGDR